jgi:hypothetical protein
MATSQVRRWAWGMRWMLVLVPSWVQSNQHLVSTARPSTYMGCLLQRGWWKGGIDMGTGGGDELGAVRQLCIKWEDNNNMAVYLHCWGSGGELTLPLLAGQPSCCVISALSLLWSLIVVLAVAFRAVIIDHYRYSFLVERRWWMGLPWWLRWEGGSKNEERQPNFACWECQHNHMVLEFQWT